MNSLNTNPLQLYTYMNNDNNKMSYSTYCKLGILSFYIIFPVNYHKCKAEVPCSRCA